MIGEWKIGEHIVSEQLGYEPLEVVQIFKGGMGVVYVLRHLDTGDQLVAKTFQPQLLARGSSEAERFIREAQLWVDLDFHLNIVPAYYVTEIYGQPFVFMSYVGGDLASWIGPRLTNDLPQILCFAVQFSDGMIHALSQGIEAHRDIKPQNCLIQEPSIDGPCLLISDFGLARAFDGEVSNRAGYLKEDGRSSGGFLSRLIHGRNANQPSEPAAVPQKLGIGLTRTGRTAGTPSYMAPERFDDFKHVDVRADIYSFGVMLYQMVSGRLPFVGRSWEEISQIHHIQVAAPLNCNGAIWAVIENCLAKNPAERFPSFEPIRDRLAETYYSLTGQRLQVLGAATGYVAGKKGEGLANLGRHEEALVRFDETLKHHSDDAKALAAKGRSLTALRRYEEALGCYQKALELKPDDADAWTGKAVALGALGRNDETLACYDHALQLAPSRASIWHSKGARLGAMGRHEEALACCDRALELDPRNAQAWFSKAHQLADINRNQEALSCYDRAAGIDRHNAQLWLSRGMTLKTLNRINGALASYDCALELNPQLRTARYEKTAALVGIGRIEEALACCELGLQLDLEDETSWANKAGVLVILRRFGEAVEAYDKALELAPNATLWRRKAETLRLAGRDEQALASLERAIELGPEVASAWGAKGDLLGMMRRFEESASAYDRALQLDPRDAVNWNNKGSALKAAGRPQEALECFDQALRIAPSDSNAYHNRELALAAKTKSAGRSDEAKKPEPITETERLDQFATQVAALHDKGVDLARAGHCEEALGFFDEGLRLAPWNANIWYDKGHAFHDLKNLEEAVACYDRALELDPQLRSGWSNKGVALITLGRFEEAMRCFETAKQLGQKNAAQAIDLCRQRLAESHQSPRR